jgi:hypothetical protein
MRVTHAVRWCGRMWERRYRQREHQERRIVGGVIRASRCYARALRAARKGRYLCLYGTAKAVP